jgi:signal transduction histidine kinase
MIHRETVAIEDIYADARIPHDAYRPTFVRSLAMVPVRRDDPIAAIGAYWATRHRPTERELGILEALANTVAIALQNAELWERSRRAVQARDEFIGIASHELKTPLTPLLLQVSALQRALDRGEGGESLRRDVARVGDHVQRLSRLVEGLLELSGLAAGEVQLSPEHVAIAPIVARVVERLRADVQRSGSALAVSVAPDLSGRWDPRRVEQILESLLSNAVRYGEGKPIEVVAARSGDHAEIAVRDHGMGIPAEAQARLFQPFERAVPATHFGGFGMGLWLARQLTEAHGGAIRVASRAGEGSLFTVTLPLAEAHARASRHLDQTVPAP